MLIGYARISTADQNLDLQHDALHTGGCQKIFDHLREGDTLVVWWLNRMGRSLKDLIEQVEGLGFLPTKIP